jgi:ATP-dependent Clp protease ATP-binding subunit ClpA
VFDLFTEPAKRAVVASQDAAISLDHDFIGTEHMLLGLVCTAGTAGEVLRHSGVEPSRAREETVRQVAATGAVVAGQAAKDALSSIGIDIAEIQRRADSTFGPGAFQYPRPAYTSHAKKAMELTLQEAKALGHEYIDTEHLLLGILAEGEGLAIKVLAALDVDVSALRPAVLARITQPAP